MQVRGQYRKTAARREDILDAAVHVFGARGYQGGTLRDVAAQAGMSHAGLLHHFATKEQLLIAVLQRRDERDAALAHTGEGDTVDRLTEVMRANTTDPSLVALFARLAADAIETDHPARAYMLERGLRQRRLLVADLLADMHSGRIPLDDPERLARELVSVLDGLQLRWLIWRNFDLPDAVQKACRSLTHSAPA